MSGENIGKNKMFGGVRGPPLGPSGVAGNLAMWQAQGKAAADNRYYLRGLGLLALHRIDLVGTGERTRADIGRIIRNRFLNGRP